MRASRAGSSAQAHPTPLGSILTQLAEADPTRPAVTCGERTVTRAQLEARANRLARAYADRGVQQGDFVSVGLANSIEFFEVCYAIWKLGAVPQPISSKLPLQELEQILNLADAALVVGFPQEMIHGRPAVAAGFEPDTSLSDAPLPACVSPSWKAPTSGGSTGRPKLIVAAAPGAFDPEAALKPFRMHSRQVQLVPGPLHHNGPFSTAMAGSLIGQHIVVLARFDAEETLSSIERHRVGYVNLVPTMMLRMLRVLDAQPGRYDLGSLEVVWHAAAPCPPWLKEHWIQLVGEDKVYESYGGTEGQAFTVISGAEWLKRRGSVGRPASGQIAVVDAEGRPLPPGEVGEVVLRSSTGSGATYRYVGALARTLGDGWESLGDMGYLDEDGYLYLADRQLDMLIVGGSNVYPAEVEAALLEHPQVLSCAVVGLPDDDLGQRVHAVVQADGDLDEEALRAFVGDRLVRYKVPRSVRFVDEPLRDDAGKVRRSAVRDQELARSAHEHPR